MRRGKAHLESKGKAIMTGVAPYGYTHVFSNKNTGERSSLVINDEEAEVIRFIFQNYLDGMGATKIAHDLTANKIPTRRDTTQRASNKKRGKYVWAKSAINHILRNETYTGVYYHNKTSDVYTDEGGRKKRQITKLDKSEWKSVSVPVIIDRATWAQVQAKLDKGKGSHKRNPSYVLSGRIKCKCGSAMGVNSTSRLGKRYRYYVCGSFSQAKGKCDLPHFRMNDVDTTTHGSLIWGAGKLDSRQTTQKWPEFRCIRLKFPDVR